MDVINELDVKSRQELREWLYLNHDKQTECWVDVKRGKPSDTDKIWYIDAVYEALCFGWIDSTVKKVSDTKTLQGLSPRTKKSNWTELNKERCRQLDKQNLMTEAGRHVWPTDFHQDDFNIHPDVLDVLKSDEDVWKHFSNFPPLYQKIRLDNIQSYRHDKKLYHTRLDKLFQTAKDNKIYGQWNDYGNLL